MATHIGWAARRVARLGVLAGSAVLGIGLLAGCGGGQSIALPGGGSIHTNGTNGASISTPHGSLTESSGGQLPSNFPKNVPQPSNSRVLSSLATSGNDSVYEVSFAVKGTVDGVARAYASQLQHSGYTIQAQTSASGESVVEATSSQWAVVATASTGTTPQVKSGEVQLALSVAPHSG